MGEGARVQVSSQSSSAAQQRIPAAQPSTYRVVARFNKLEIYRRRAQTLLVPRHAIAMRCCTVRKLHDPEDRTDPAILISRQTFHAKH